MSNIPYTRVYGIQVIHRPKFFLDVSNSIIFKGLMLFLLLLELVYTIIMANFKVENHRNSNVFLQIHIFFTFAFFVEFIIIFFAKPSEYFKKLRNCVDFIALILSFISIYYENSSNFQRSSNLKKQNQYYYYYQLRQSRKKDSSLIESRKIASFQFQHNEINTNKMHKRRQKEMISPISTFSKYLSKKLSSICSPRDSPFNILDVLQLIRLVRVFYINKYLKSEFKSFMKVSVYSFPILLFFTVFVVFFGFVGFYLYGKASPSNFGSIFISIFTVFSVTTKDGWVRNTKKINKGIVAMKNQAILENADFGTENIVGVDHEVLSVIDDNGGVSMERYDSAGLSGINIFKFYQKIENENETVKVNASNSTSKTASNDENETNESNEDNISVNNKDKLSSNKKKKITNKKKKKKDKKTDAKGDTSKINNKDKKGKSSKSTSKSKNKANKNKKKKDKQTVNDLKDNSRKITDENIMKSKNEADKNTAEITVNNRRNNEDNESVNKTKESIENKNNETSSNANKSLNNENNTNITKSNNETTNNNESFKEEVQITNENNESSSNETDCANNSETDIFTGSKQNLIKKEIENNQKFKAKTIIHNSQEYKPVKKIEESYTYTVWFTVTIVTVLGTIISAFIASKVTDTFTSGTASLEHKEKQKAIRKVIKLLHKYKPRFILQNSVESGKQDYLSNGQFLEMIRILTYLKKSKESLNNFIKDNKIRLLNKNKDRFKYNYNYVLEYYNQEYYHFTDDNEITKEILKRRRSIEELEMMLQYYLELAQNAFVEEVIEKHKKNKRRNEEEEEEEEKADDQVNANEAIMNDFKDEINLKLKNSSAFNSYISKNLGLNNSSAFKDFESNNSKANESNDNNKDDDNDGGGCGGCNIKLSNLSSISIHRLSDVSSSDNLNLNQSSTFDSYNNENESSTSIKLSNSSLHENSNKTTTNNENNKNSSLHEPISSSSRNLDEASTASHGENNSLYEAITNNSCNINITKNDNLHEPINSNNNNNFDEATTTKNSSIKTLDEAKTNSNASELPIRNLNESSVIKNSSDINHSERQKGLDEGESTKNSDFPLSGKLGPPANRSAFFNEIEEISVSDYSDSDDDSSVCGGGEEFKCFGAAASVTAKEINGLPQPPTSMKSVIFNKRFVKSMKIALKHMINDMERSIELQSALIARLSELSHK